jgi:hypothetical protein
MPCLPCTKTGIFSFFSEPSAATCLPNTGVLGNIHSLRPSSVMLYWVPLLLASALAAATQSQEWDTVGRHHASSVRCCPSRRRIAYEGAGNEQCKHCDGDRSPLRLCRIRARSHLVQHSCG